jgi:hypothetical protein
LTPFEVEIARCQNQFARSTHASRLLCVNYLTQSGDARGDKFDAIDHDRFAQGDAVRLERSAGLASKRFENLDHHRSQLGNYDIAC